jgi:hypothetical protein
MAETFPSASVVTFLVAFESVSLFAFTVTPCVARDLVHFNPQVPHKSKAEANIGKLQHRVTANQTAKQTKLHHTACHERLLNERELDQHNDSPDTPFQPSLFSKQNHHYSQTFHQWGLNGTLFTSIIDHVGGSNYECMLRCKLLRRLLLGRREEWTGT